MRQAVSSCVVNALCTMAETNARLSHKHRKEYTKRGLDLSDLIQEGNLSFATQLRAV